MQIKKPTIVLITHTNPLKKSGGVEYNALMKINHFAEQGYNVITISPRRKSKIGLVTFTLNHTTFPFPITLQFAINLVKFFKVTNIYIEHLLNWNKNIETLTHFVENHKAPKTLFLHDLHFRCTHPHCDVNGKYCGAMNQGFDKSQCTTCPNGGGKLTTHHQCFIKFMEMSRKIVFPSQFLMDFYNKFFANKFAKKTITHPIQHLHNTNIPSNSSKINGKIKIAFIGVSCQHKGYQHFLELAKNSSLKNNYEFYVIGSKIRNQDDKQFIKNIITNYRTDNIPSILQNNSINIAFLFSQVPESYSFTMHEAIASCIPIITSNMSGNIHSQIANNSVYGRVFEDINDVIKLLSNKDGTLKFIADNPNKHLYSPTLNTLFAS
ncbi:MAG: glycosyltransferase involved in cell wall biosynthesis [Candidatus Deianiraeaceae bacterium]|jgi:glycosyltransferase involved in cell wall biosynthesis